MLHACIQGFGSLQYVWLPHGYIHAFCWVQPPGVLLTCWEQAYESEFAEHPDLALTWAASPAFLRRFQQGFDAYIAGVQAAQEGFQLRLCYVEPLDVEHAKTIAAASLQLQCQACCWASIGSVPGST